MEMKSCLLIDNIGAAALLPTALKNGGITPEQLLLDRINVRLAFWANVHAPHVLPD